MRLRNGVCGRVVDGSSLRKGYLRFLVDPHITEIRGCLFFDIAFAGYRCSSLLRPGEHIHSSRPHRGQAERPAFFLAKECGIRYHSAAG